MDRLQKWPAFVPGRRVRTGWEGQGVLFGDVPRAAPVVPNTVSFRFLRPPRSHEKGAPWPWPPMSLPEACPTAVSRRSPKHGSRRQSAPAPGPHWRPDAWFCALTAAVRWTCPLALSFVLLFVKKGV